MKEKGKSPLIEMPLHTITEVYGTQGLIQRFSWEISRFEVNGQHMANQALMVAHTLHLQDRRVREPYINHLLRVSARIMTYYGIDDPNLASAALLHDSVEDHAADLAPQDKISPREAALSVISGWFNSSVASLVSGVTNPEFDKSRDTNEQYAEHLLDLTQNGEPGSVIIKLSDFTDNATGLIYTQGPKVTKLARKYLPIVPILKSALDREDLPLSPEAKNHIDQQLDLTKVRLLNLSA